MVAGYGDLGRWVDSSSKSGLSSAKRTLCVIQLVKSENVREADCKCYTLDRDDLEDLFLREDEDEDLPCSRDLSAVISPSESDGKSFNSSSELSVPGNIYGEVYKYNLIRVNEVEGKISHKHHSIFIINNYFSTISMMV